jgi:hypothetical protein
MAWDREMTAPASTPLDQRPPPSPIGRRLWRNREGIAFWTLTLAYLIPVWAFHFIPTQDGPSHLANAQILKDYGKSAAGYEQVFELRGDPLPNWTSHALLAALLYLAPPLTAEKILVSLYILGFAGAFRYYLGAFGERCRALSWMGLLFIYNRCFWMGFYNYCLSLVLFWVILGYLLRRRDRLSLAHALVLMALFGVEYFTHLVGFLLAVGSSLAAAVMVRPRRLLANVILVALAAAPAVCLVMDYFQRTGFFESHASHMMIEHPSAVIHGNNLSERISQQVDALDGEIFEYHAGKSTPFTVYLVPYFIVLGLCTALGGLRRTEAERAAPGWFFPFLLGWILLGIYVLVPQHLTSENGVLNHGGFIKTRLALLPPLVWLACLREPPWLVLRIPTRLLTILLLAANLVFVTRTFQSGNQELTQYTAGIEAVGRGHRLFAVENFVRVHPLVNPLLHAADYYCQGTDNVNFDNYEATTPHFPVKYRRGVSRAMGYFEGYSNQAMIDSVLCWHSGPGPGLTGWDKIFSEGPLQIYRRPKTRDRP